MAGFCSGPRQHRAGAPLAWYVTALHTRRVAPNIHAILLDSGRPSAVIRELGGTGRAHDWSISRRVVAAVDRPVFLAGGISSENVSEAIGAIRRFGIDVCSLFRTDGRLDRSKLKRLVAVIERTDSEPGRAL